MEFLGEEIRRERRVEGREGGVERRGL